jgi:hypothetical protein
MLDFLSGRRRAAWPSERKLRLFACACARRVFPLIRFEPARRAVEVAERYADGEATDAELKAAYQAAVKVPSRRGVGKAVDAAASGRWAAVAPPLRWCYRDDGEIERWVPVRAAAWSASSARHSWGRPFSEREREAQARLLRDVIAPFAPFDLPARWRTAMVVGLARAIYAERAFDRMPILADALEEAGCGDVRVLTHCRTRAEHVRGCWVIDRLLGYESGESYAARLAARTSAKTSRSAR